MASETLVLEEVHANLATRRLGLASRQATFRQMWEGQDAVADLPTARMPRITGDLGHPYATVKLSTAELEVKPVKRRAVAARPELRVEPMALTEARVACEYKTKIVRAILTFMELTGCIPNVALCWAMDLLLMGAPERLTVETEVGPVEVVLITESELPHVQHGQNIICEARGKPTS